MGRKGLETGSRLQHRLKHEKEDDDKPLIQWYPKSAILFGFGGIGDFEPFAFLLEDMPIAAIHPRGISTRLKNREIQNFKSTKLQRPELNSAINAEQRIACFIRVLTLDRCQHA